MVLLYSAGVSASGGVRGAVVPSCCADALDVQLPATTIARRIPHRIHVDRNDSTKSRGVGTYLMIDHPF